MKRKLTNRETALVIRCLRIGMATGTVARILNTRTSIIAGLIETNDDCKQAVKARVRESVTAVRIKQRDDVHCLYAPEPTTPVYPVLHEAHGAVKEGFDAIADLRSFVAARYGITEAQMDDASRIKRHIFAREAAVCAARLLWPHLSLAQIGQHFANRPHATIHHILKKHKLPTAAIGQKHAA